MNREISNKRLFLLTIVGKDIIQLADDLEKLNNTFFKNYKEEVVQYGNSIYFVSEKDTEEIFIKINKTMKKDFGYVLVDITDNLNVFDFRGNLNEKHLSSNKFVNIIKMFTTEKEEKVLEKTDNELLIEAIENEDYENAALIRDRINSVI
jgi:hypothetical protein